MPYKEVRLIFLASAALAVIAWAVLIALINSSRDAEIENGYRLAQSVADILAERTNNTFMRVDRVLAHAAYELSRDNSPNRIKELVDAQIISMEDLVQMSFTDAQGVDLGASNGPDIKRIPLADREHIRAQLDRQVDGAFVGKPVVGRLSGKWSIQITRRFDNPDGSTKGVVVASIDPHLFSGMGGAVSTPNFVVTELIGLDGVLRARSADLDASLAAPDRSQVVALAKLQNSGRVLDHGSDGVERLAYFEAVRGLPLFVLSGVSRDEVIAKTLVRQRAFIGLGVAITALLLLFAAVLSRTVVRLKQRETEASAAQARLYGAVNALSLGFTIYDSKGRLVLANDAYKRMYPEIAELMKPGLPFEELKLAGVEAAYFALRGAFAEVWRKAWTDKSVMNFGPVDAQLPDGRWIRVTEQRTPEGDMVGLRDDISERKLREQELARNREELEAQARQLREQADEMSRLAKAAGDANKAKSAFLAAMSHEIRTPLNAIVGFSALLSKTGLEDEQRKFLRTVESSARHLRVLVNDILDFSRMEAGRIELEIAPFALDELVGSVGDTARMLIGAKPVLFRVAVEPGLPKLWRGDAARVTQVCLNLVSNAAKFTHHGEIRFEIARASGADASTRLRFTVVDTGIGIPAEARERIFEAFDQGDVRGKARQAGAGLGLAISRGLVGLMGGVIDLTSAPGEGSAFWFEAPLEPLQAEATAPSGDIGSARAASGALDILVADDSSSSRLLVNLLLVKRGHRVTAVEDGLQAVERARKQRFDLAILDLQMPELGGIEAARRIRALPPSVGARRIVALTAEAFEDERRAALDAGISEVLTKPFDESELDALLARSEPWVEAAQ